MTQELGSRHILNVRACKLLAQSFENGNGVRGSAVVIAEQDFSLVREGPDHGDLDAACLKWQRAVVLEQYHRLVGNLASEIAVLGAVQLAFIDLVVRHSFRRIEHAQFHTRSEEADSAVSISLSFR